MEIDPTISPPASKAVLSAIRNRVTVKVMSEEPLPAMLPRSAIMELIATAGWAPFHRACDSSHQTQLAGIEPWRMYALDATNCQLLREKMPTENAGKIPAMLAAAEALIQVTWLPNTSAMKGAEEQLFDATLENMEHIAATSAAIQNLLLAATARGIRNYWSSGGVLRSAEVFKLLGISSSEILLGSVFLFSEPNENATIVNSKLRDRRTPAEQWMRWVELAS